MYTYVTHSLLLAMSEKPQLKWTFKQLSFSKREEAPLKGGIEKSSEEALQHFCKDSVINCGVSRNEKVVTKALSLLLLCRYMFSKHTYSLNVQFVL